MKIKIIDYGYENLPNRAHYNDAGADVCACPHNEEQVTIWPYETIKIPFDTKYDLYYNANLLFLQGVDTQALQKFHHFLCGNSCFFTILAI